MEEERAEVNLWYVLILRAALPRLLAAMTPRAGVQRSQQTISDRRDRGPRGRAYGPVLVCVYGDWRPNSNFANGKPYLRRISSGGALLFKRRNSDFHEWRGQRHIRLHLELLPDFGKSSE